MPGRPRALLAVVALSAVGCGGVHAAGRCGLELAAVDGRIRASLSGTGSDPLVVVHEGHVAWRGRDKHVFWLPDYRGADDVRVRSTRPDGRICSAHRTLREKN